MLWPHTKTLDVPDKHRKSKIANRRLFISAQDKFYDLLLPPSLKSQILAVNLKCENLNDQLQSLDYNFIPRKLTFQLS